MVSSWSPDEPFLLIGPDSYLTPIGVKDLRDEGIETRERTTLP
jgi:hypothetical protein